MERGFGVLDLHPQRPANPYCCWKIQELGGWRDSAEARRLLEAVAAAAQPVMQRHRYEVPLLAELPPDAPVRGYNAQVLQGGGGSGGGATLEIRLRLRATAKHGQFAGSTRFQSLNTLKRIMAHELAHIEVIPHDAAFHRLWAQLSSEFGLVASGMLQFDHVRAEVALAVEARAALGAAVMPGGGRVLGGGGGGAPGPAALRRAAAAAAEARARCGAAAPLGGGGSALRALPPPRKAAATAAEARAAGSVDAALQRVVGGASVAVKVRQQQGDGARAAAAAAAAAGAPKRRRGAAAPRQEEEVVDLTADDDGAALPPPQRRQGVMVAVSEDWSCAACTYRNEAGHLACAVCGLAVGH